ncbi:T9SS type A sorting domain-containing protein [Luteibaculum oceani]|uniref:T9SS type A sorting domain-containing protein n=1 Tax=Luteibaculum oceani TaxID=1294296 RepID=A0A5C6USJ1_9FLAO|nr:T9SS type A sorting domain-containing protein [Luteibaculum oceani]TXC75226.1 T9SS type A sorting domain-containing protein [Luteibaculum oceani]
MRTLYYFVMMFISTGIHSQSYTKLLEDDKVWNVSYSNYANIPPTGYTTEYSFHKDTIINGITYQDFGALLREDTVNRRVFYWYHNEEYLLYDFNANVGDTILTTHFQIVIDSISTITLENSEKRKIFYHSGSNTGEYYIEGIGSDHGLVEISEANGPPAINFNCLTKNGEKIFGSCTNSSIQTNEKHPNTLLVSPNPVNEILHLTDIAGLNSGKVQILDQQGQILLEEKITTTLYLNNVSSGEYLLRLFDKGNEIVGQSRFIKE